MKKMILTMVTMVAVFFSGCAGNGNAETSVNNGSQYSSEDYSVEVPLIEVTSEQRFRMNYEYKDFEFDENGFLIKKTSSGQEMGYITYAYDDGGMLITERRESPGKGYIQHDYSYDERGFITRDDCSSDYSDIDNGKNFIYEYETDDQQRPIKKIEINESSGYTLVYEYVYDDRGNAIEETQTSYKDGIGGAVNNTYTLQNKYDSDGNLVKVNSKDNKTGDGGSSSYNYDAVGSISASTSDGKLAKKDSWKMLKEAFPSPETVCTSIKKDNSEEMLFRLSGNKKEAILNMHLYLAVLEQICGASITDAGSDYEITIGEIRATITLNYIKDNAYYIRIEM